MHFIYPNEKNPDYTRGNVRKDKKKHELRKKFTKISKTQIAKTYLAKHIICGTLTILIWRMI